MASDHLKATLEGLKQTLEEDVNFFDDYVHQLHMFYAENGPAYSVENGKLTIQLLVGDTPDEERFTTDNTQSSILPTIFGLVCDTKFSQDSEAFISEDYETFLDLEYRLLRSLQSHASWNAATHHNGFNIQGIDRDVPVLTEDGEVDQDIRRFIVSLYVEVYFDRDDGVLG